MGPSFIVRSVSNLVIAIAALTTPALAACSFSTQPVSGEYGGFTFYYGLLHQFDAETEKTLNANKAVTVGHIGECAQACLQDQSCSAVTYRLTSSGQCLFYAGYDFETNRHMGLKIIHLGETSTSSALIREWFEGPSCQ
jgi:hypothetical protein